jgi:Txe/YoeB family toxin of Txe-Axe toxin-antitoxin module
MRSRPRAESPANFTTSTQTSGASCYSPCRRIDSKHRVVYLVQDDDIVFLQARYHDER